MFAGHWARGRRLSRYLAARVVRAYAFDRIEAEGPVQVVISITPLGEEGPIEDGYRHEGRVGMRNIQPNPSFEEATVTGFPDYYWPFDWTAGRIGWRHRVGPPDASLILAGAEPSTANASCAPTPMTPRSLWAYTCAAWRRNTLRRSPTCCRSTPAPTPPSR